MLDRIDREMSSYRSDSELSQFNQSMSTAWINVSAETVRVVDEAQRISVLSYGAFDITVDPLVKLWGFGPERHTRVPDQTIISEMQKRVDYNLLKIQHDPPALRKIRPDVSIDLGAIGKGYAADAVGECLSKIGVSNYLVAIGGELCARGKSENNRPWHTGIETPVAHLRGIQCVIELCDRGIATCGDYRNFYESAGKHYCHIIDPHTGAPVAHNLASVTVICNSTMEADAMGAALMVLGPDAGMKLASKMKLPVLFIQRQANGFKEVETPEFEKMRVASANVTRGNNP